MNYDHVDVYDLGLLELSKKNLKDIKTNKHPIINSTVVNKFSLILKLRKYINDDNTKIEKLWPIAQISPFNLLLSFIDKTVAMWSASSECLNPIKKDITGCSIIIIPSNKKFHFLLYSRNKKSPPIQSIDGRIKCQLVDWLDFIFSNRN